MGQIQDMCNTANALDRLTALERMLQGSVLGMVFLPVVTCLTSLVAKGDECEHCNIPALVSLLTRCFQVTKIFQTKIQEKKSESAEENGILTGVKIPSPW